MSVVIEPAHTNDLPALFALLEKSGLPQEGLSDHVSTTLVAREDQVIMPTKKESATHWFPDHNTIRTPA